MLGSVVESVSLEYKLMRRFSEVVGAIREEFEAELMPEDWADSGSHAKSYLCRFSKKLLFVAGEAVVAIEERRNTLDHVNHLTEPKTEYELAFFSFSCCLNVVQLLL